MLTTNSCANQKKIAIYGESERKRFENYQKALAEETDIIKVWRNYNRDFFPFDLEGCISEAKKFLPKNVEEFAKYCDTLQAPAILQEIFAVVRNEYGKDLILDSMAKAPICAAQDEKDELIWDKKSFVAPTMTDFLFDVLVEENTEAFAQKIAQTLSKREDGYFLAWNYVKYLLSGDMRKPDVIDMFIENIGQEFSPSLKERYGEKNCLDVSERFSQTGLLGNTGKESKYLNLLTQMQFYDREKLDDYIPAFEDSILLEDEMFKAFSPRPLLCHYYISDIYLASENPVESWIKIWENMSPARHRVWFNRYDEFSIGIERNINFLLIVGIAMIEQLYQDDNDGDLNRGENLCETLLKILSDMINRRGDKSSQLNREMLTYLVTWRFMFYKSEKGVAIASDKMVEFILSNSWQPRRMLEILSQLKANGFQPNLQIGNETADSFYDKIIWAADYAIAQEKSEYNLAALGRHIKNWAIGIW